MINRLHYKGKATLFIALAMFTIICLNINIVAGALTIDTQLNYDKTFKGYPEITLVDWFGLGEEVFKGNIESHTSTCSSNCESTIKVLIKEGLPYYDSIKFINEYTDKEVQIYSYKIEKKIGTKEIITSTYEECVHDDLKNCVTKENTATEILWQEITDKDLSDGLEAEIRISGSKKASQNIDWIITSQGESLDAWASWGASPYLTGLQAYYKLDEGTGIDSKDEKGVYNLTGITTPHWVTYGKLNSATFLNATESEYWNSTFSQTGNEDWSISLWFNFTVDNGINHYIFMIGKSGGGTAMAVYKPDASANLMFTDLAADTLLGTTNAGLWRNLVISYDKAGVIRTYLDGINYMNKSQAITLNAGSLKLGSNAAVSEVWYGLIDEVAVYNRTLSQSDVNALYNSGNAFAYPFAVNSITLNYPADNNVSVTYSNKFNISASPTSPATLVNISYWDNSTGTWGLRQTITTTSSAEFTRTLSNGYWVWGASACDSDGDCGYSSNRTILINKTISVSLNTPADLTSTINILNAFNCSGVPSGTATITNVSLRTNQTGTMNIVNTSTISSSLLYYSLPVGNHLWTCSACDSDGDCGVSSENRTISIVNVAANSYNYNVSTTELNRETFTANFSYGSASSISVGFMYNNTRYSSTLSTYPNGFIASNTINVPSISVKTNKTFYWIIDVDSTQTNTTWLNQTVNPLIFQLCNTTVNNTMVRFNVYDTTTPANWLNASFKSSWKIFSNYGTTYKTYSFENISAQTNSFAFCSQGALSSRVDSTIQYYATNYANNYFYFTNESLTTNDRNISLYLLNSSLATLTQIKVLDSAYTGIVNATVQIDKYDIGSGTYTTIGFARTDNNGQDLAYLNWYDTFYRFTVTKLGQTLLVSENTKISATPVNLRILTTSTNVMDKFEDLEYSLTFNNATSTFILSFTKPSGVETGCLRVIKRADNDTDICLYCDTSDNVYLTCPITGYGNGTYIGAFYATGSYKLIDWISTTVGGDLAKTINALLGNDDAMFYSLMFSGIVVSMSFIHPIMAIVGLGLGIIGGAALGFNIINYAAMIGIIAIGGIMIWFLKR